MSKSICATLRCKWKDARAQLLPLLCVTLHANLFVFSGFICCWFFLYLIYLNVINSIYLLEYSLNRNTFDLTNTTTTTTTYFSIQVTEFHKRLIDSLLPFLFLSMYSIHWLIDYRAEERGAHPSESMRRLKGWTYMRDYFPIRMITTELTETGSSPSALIESNSDTLLADGELANEEKLKKIQELFSPEYNYLLVYHPHGIFGIGSFINFVTEANHFSEIFKGIKSWVATLEINFKVPFARDFLLKNGMISATYNAMSYLLDKTKCGRTGNMLVVVIGGAPESLESRPGKYVLHTNKRYGVFKLALMTGTHLVPCVSFGETNSYKQVSNPIGSKLRSFQDKFTEWATFTIPLFHAYFTIPYQKPIYTVVGRPIRCEKFENPTRQQVSDLKDLYLNELKKLFDKYKPIYDPEADDVVFF